MPDIFKSANTRIRKWATARKPQMQNAMDALGIKHRTKSPSPAPSKNALRVKTRRKNGLIHKIGYSIPRHMVYVHKGVGRGTPIAKAGTTNRKAKPWFNPVIEKHIEELGDIVAEEIGGAILNNLFIR